MTGSLHDIPKARICTFSQWKVVVSDTFLSLLQVPHISDSAESQCLKNPKCLATKSGWNDDLSPTSHSKKCVIILRSLSNHKSRFGGHVITKSHLIVSTNFSKKTCILEDSSIIGISLRFHFPGARKITIPFSWQERCSSWILFPAENRPNATAT